MATGDVGTLTPSALESFRAAYKSPPMSQDLDLLDPFFKTILAPEPSSAGFSIEHGKKGSSEEEMAPTIEFEGSIVAFRLYAAWVYSGLIQKRILKIGVPGAENISYSNIGQAYILGDKLKDHKFKNAIVDCLLETIVSQGKMDLTLPNLIFDKTSASAPLKKLLVDIYVLYRHKDWLKPDGSSQTNSAIFLSGPFSCLPRSSRS
ncbi:hypothetical protein E4T52_12341 [Aureobasidium sp. EXF-3400]|nr:hypothetical protein E4T52_12341 [Aureobasidium sp. EXF-3400]